MEGKNTTKKYYSKVLPRRSHCDSVTWLLFNGNVRLLAGCMFGLNLTLQSVAELTHV